jgi:cobalamin biosynthesis protein CbiG
VLVLGIGARAGVTVQELEDLVVGVVLDVTEVGLVATVEGKDTEPALVELCARHGWPLVAHTAELLATTPVPTPSQRVASAVGTPSVAEAAALQHGVLVVTKTTSRSASLAVARAL